MYVCAVQSAFFSLLFFLFIRLFFIKGGGPIIPEVVQEVQPIHPTGGKCLWPSHSGVWGLHISTGQSGKGINLILDLDKARAEITSLIHSLFPLLLLSKSPFLSLQDEVNQIMETNLWLRHVSSFCPLCDAISDATIFALGAWFCGCFRCGTTTNWDGLRLSMMGLNSYGFHRIRFGGRTLFCTTSKCLCSNVDEESFIFL